jgi:hypothetical protein
MGEYSLVARGGTTDSPIPCDDDELDGDDNGDDFGGNRFSTCRFTWRNMSAVDLASATNPASPASVPSPLPPSSSDSTALSASPPPPGSSSPPGPSSPPPPCISESMAPSSSDSVRHSRSLTSYVAWNSSSNRFPPHSFRAYRQTLVCVLVCV